MCIPFYSLSYTTFSGTIRCISVDQLNVYSKLSGNCRLSQISCMMCLKCSHNFKMIKKVGSYSNNFMLSVHMVS